MDGLTTTYHCQLDTEYTKQDNGTIKRPAFCYSSKTLLCLLALFLSWSAFDFELHIGFCVVRIGAQLIYGCMESSLVGLDQNGLTVPFQVFKLFHRRT